MLISKERGGASTVKDQPIFGRALFAMLFFRLPIGPRGTALNSAPELAQGT
jgi:hypothetical protein